MLLKSGLSYDRRKEAFEPVKILHHHG